MGPPPKYGPKSGPDAGLPRPVIVIQQKMAEREGFEPSNGFSPLHTFQACPFDHSATTPLAWPSSRGKATHKAALTNSRGVYPPPSRSRCSLALYTDSPPNNAWGEAQRGSPP